MNQPTLFSDIYTHKLSGEKLRIKKIFGSVVSCYVEKPFKFSWNLNIDTIVCDMNNLIPVI